LSDVGEVVAEEGAALLHHSAVLLTDLVDGSAVVVVLDISLMQFGGIGIAKLFDVRGVIGQHRRAKAEQNQGREQMGLHMRSPLQSTQHKPIA
jgi:hypothetical protein